MKEILEHNSMCLQNGVCNLLLTFKKVCKYLLNSLHLFAGDRNVLALILLPYMFKKLTKQTTRSITGKNWNPEKAEVLSTFLFHLKVTLQPI